MSECPYVHEMLKNPSPKLHIKHQKWHNRRNWLWFSWMAFRAVFFRIKGFGLDFRGRRDPDYRRLGAADNCITSLILVLPFVWIDEGEVICLKNLRFSWSAQ